MVDFRVDDGFQWHPKTAGMSLQAVGLWTLAGTWCARYLTDGYIPGDILQPMVGRNRAALQELVDRNLLVEYADGFQFHNWLQYQRSRADVEAERERWRVRQQRARQKRWGTDGDVTP